MMILFERLCFAARTLDWTHYLLLITNTNCVQAKVLLSVYKPRRSACLELFFRMRVEETEGEW